MKKLAFFTSHPIQYQAPIFRKLSGLVDTTVYFMWDFGVKKSIDPEFGVEVKWDTPILEGYSYKFLNNYSWRKENSFIGLINPGIIIEIWKGKYDYLFFHAWNSFSNCVGMLTAIVLGVPFFIHGDNSMMSEIYKPKWKRFIKWVILRILFIFPAAFLYMGEEDKKFYKFHGVPEKKLVFMPYAADNEYMIKHKNSLNRNEERSKLGLRDNEVAVLFSGKLVSRKRPFDVLLAFEKITESKNLNSKLLFMGDGPLRSEMENYVAEKKIPGVVFLGFQNLSQIPKIYISADIFVMTSFNEVWGLVVNEAMCFQLPIISSNLVGAVPDLVKEGENGFIYDCGDVDELAEKLFKLISNPDLRRSFGSRSFDIVQKYSAYNDALAIVEAMK